MILDFDARCWMGQRQGLSLFLAVRLFEGERGWRGEVWLREIGGCRFRVVCGMRVSPGTAKAAAAFVPHCATAVHMGMGRRDQEVSVVRQLILWAMVRWS